jgi:polyferredoxin
MSQPKYSIKLSGELMIKVSKLQIVRIIILVFFLILISILATLHQVIGGGPKGAPPIDALCPFGGLEVIYKYLVSGGEFIQRTNISNFVLLVGSIILAVAAGRYFCGWICMLGFLQELFGKLGLKIFGKRFILNQKIDKPLRFLKYIILFAVLFLTWKTGELIIRPFDPFAAYAHIPAGISVFQEMLGGIIVLAVSLIASMFVDRFFCKYLCPMGAFLGILNKISIFRIKREESTCIHCSKCSKICPVNIDVEKIDTVKSSECINCFECITVCPTKKNTLSTKIIGKRIILPAAAGFGLAIYIGIIGISMASGVWKTQADSLEASVKESGELNPDNIRGFMTMEEIAKTFNINIKDLYDKLEITKDKVPYMTLMKKVKDLSGKDGKIIGEERIKNAVKELIGLSLKNETDSEKNVIINTAEETKKAEKQSEKIKEPPKYVEKKQITEKIEKPVSKDENNFKTVEKDNASTFILPNPEDIKGTMTLKEIAETYKIDLNALYEKINISREKVPESTAGRDIKGILSKEGRNFEVQEIREALKEMLN